MRDSDQQLVSVIMSVYREPLSYLRPSSQSILGQTHQNLELVVVLDDPDNTDALEYLETLSHTNGRVHLLVNGSNVGLARSLNKAIDESRGSIIARMDADDVAMPERIAHELAYMIENDLDVVACAVDKIDAEGVAWGEIRPFSTDPADVAALLPMQNVLVHPTVLFRRRVIDSVGCYRNFPSCQDYDLWLRLVSAGARIGLQDEKLLNFRRHRESVTSRRRFSQIACERYIRKLHAERLANGSSDSFSEDALRAFLADAGVFDEARSAREGRLLTSYADGVRNLKRRKVLVGVSQVLRSLPSASVREGISTSLRSKALRRRIRRGG